MLGTRSLPFAFGVFVLAAIVSGVSSVTPTHAAPAIGFIEKFSAAGVSTWASQAALSNPGTLGADGAGDGFLLIVRSTAGNLGAFSSGAEYLGDWRAAHVNQIKLKLNDVGASQGLEIHLNIGSSSNLWQYNTAFIPPSNAWGSFSVDLDDSLNFTHTINFGGSFAGALQNADRILVRHDHAPFMKTPDTIAGDFGLDDIELTNPLVGVPLPATAAARPVELAAPYPNPARDAVACAFETFDASPVRLSVFDAAGRLVRSATLAGTGPGRRIWMWDGLDDRGVRAPAGSYRVRAAGIAGGTSRPIVRIN